MLIDGKTIAQAIYARLKPQVAQLPFVPVVVDVMVGDDPVQERFVRVKQKRAEEIGVTFKTARFSADVETAQLVSEVEDWCMQDDVCGVIVQLPLPPTVQTEAVLAALSPEKDIDKLTKGSSEAFLSPTAGAILSILESLGSNMTAKQVAIVGQGRLVGLPTARLLRQRGYRVEVADARTQDLARITLEADILITGVGKPALIVPEFVKAGAIVIDAGTSESGGSIKGDVAPAVAEKAGFLTPVPGGVGPVTVAVLLENAVRSAQQMIAAK